MEEMRSHEPAAEFKGNLHVFLVHDQPYMG